MKYKRSVSVLLAVVLLASTAVLFVHAVSLTDEPDRDVREVISAELLELLGQRMRQRFRVATNAQTVELPMEEQLPISVWLTGIDADAVEAEALEETGWNRDLIRERSSAGESIPSDAVDAYIEAERRIYAQRQRAANEAFLASCPATLSEDETTTQFISSYAPMVLADASDAAIWTLAECAEVENISYMPEMEFLDNDVTTDRAVTTGLPETRADYVRDTLGYTGKGVKIGQIEIGVPNVSGGTFTSANVTIRPGNWEIREHSTAVAEIMVSSGNHTSGSQTKGIAPDAKLYCVGLPEAETNEEEYADYYDAVEWLISQGVNVINMSFGWLDPLGQSFDRYPNYDTVDRWTDHIAISHSVHFVLAVGNLDIDKDDEENLIHSNWNVAHPALAYNAIAVGALDTRALAEANHELVGSAYTDDASGANKPDLVAPGACIMTSSFLDALFSPDENGDRNEVSGTSFAAPIVTGIIAQLLEQNASLKTQQDTVKAILTAAVNHSKIRYTSASTEFEQCGAGCVDAQGSGYAARQNQYRGSNFAANTSAGSTREYSFTIRSSDDLKRISLTWLKHVSIIGSHTDPDPTFNEGNFPRLKLEILNASGTVIQTAYHSTGNLEIIQLDNPTAGTYKIRVTLMTTSNRQVNFAVVWW